MHSAEENQDKTSVLRLLRIQKKQKEENPEIRNEEDISARIQELFKKAETLKPASGPKTDALTGDVTEEEQQIINQRVALQQDLQKLQKTKKTKKIRSLHYYITEEEALTALEDCKEDEEEATARLTDLFYLHDVRKMIAQKAMKQNEASQASRITTMSTSISSIKPDFRQLNKIREVKLNSPTKTRFFRKNGNFKKLKLDDALKQGTFEGWSEARIRAYKLIDKNPNAYYYRFNPPGVEQKNGKWSPEEKELFFKRMKEIGVNGQWGIFSTVIPGRVGYQCSNFYRQLVESGEVNDPNYVLDDSGKAHFLFSKGIVKKGRKKLQQEGGEEESTSNNAPTINYEKGNKKGRKKRKRKKSEGGEEEEEDDDDDNDEEYMPSSWKKKKMTKKIPLKRLKIQILYPDLLTQ